VGSRFSGLGVGVEVVLLVDEPIVDPLFFPHPTKSKHAAMSSATEDAFIAGMSTARDAGRRSGIEPRGPAYYCERFARLLSPDIVRIRLDDLREEDDDVGIYTVWGARRGRAPAR
jgi:hypothetical protein